MNKGQAKTGRKGDPRMHRAVAARMENPELSLFEALRIGGFDYPADEDASIMDAEKVTLGQRKNQLSRRLRLARKQQEEQGNNGTNGNNQNGMMDDAMGGMAGMNGLSAKMKLQRLQQQQATSNSAMSSEAQRQLEKLMQHSQASGLSSGVKRNAQLAELGPDAEMHPSDEDGLMDEKGARRMAKFHPQFQQLFIPRAASVRNSFTSGSGSNLGAQLSGTTPQLGPLAAPLSQLGQPPASSFASAAGASSNPSLFPSAGGLLGQTSGGLGQRKTATAPPSGVAIASLSATAQSVGLSLEQLAVALSSSSNLVKVLSNNSGSEQQQELALRLFRNESRALYQRCMLLAGFRPEDAEEKSQNHLQFAFSAWQMEGKRLQELMGASESGCGSNTCSSAGGNLKMGSSGNLMSTAQQMDSTQQQLQQQLQQQQQQQHARQQDGHHHGHEHGHAHAHQHGHNHAHGHAHAHGHNHNDNSNHSHSNSNAAAAAAHTHHGHDHSHGHEHGHNGQHVHQLEGKCGHKAIVHQPKDGSAHIDFVVGDKVECYHGVQPVGNKSLSVWPSKYKCDELGCEEPQGDNGTRPVVDLDGINHANNTNNPNNDSKTPKLLDLSDIDLTGSEWNSDLNGFMGGTLLGLFKLGDSDDKGEAPQQGGASSADGFGIQV